MAAMAAQSGLAHVCLTVGLKAATYDFPNRFDCNFISFVCCFDANEINSRQLLNSMGIKGYNLIKSPDLYLTDDI